MISLFLGTGTDVAGEVVRVGSDVKNFKAGDKVLAILSVFVSAYLFFFLVFSVYFVVKSLSIKSFFYVHWVWLFNICVQFSIRFQTKLNLTLSYILVLGLLVNFSL